MRHAVADQPPVGLDLGFAGAAEEAEAAALALEVGPAAHQPPGLIVEMGELDLQPPFGGRRALAEDLEDQAGAVDHLGLGLVLEVLLLDRGQRGVDDQQLGLVLARPASAISSTWPLPNRVAGADRAHPESARVADDVDADRLGQARAPPRAAPRRSRARPRRGSSGTTMHGALAARDLDRAIAVEDAQASVLRIVGLAAPSLSGCAGCTVEMACL